MSVGGFAKEGVIRQSVSCAQRGWDGEHQVAVPTPDINTDFWLFGKLLANFSHATCSHTQFLQAVATDESQEPEPEELCVLGSRFAPRRSLVPATGQTAGQELGCANLLGDVCKSLARARCPHGELHPRERPSPGLLA